jgi:hypothetical protein
MDHFVGRRGGANQAKDCHKREIYLIDSMCGGIPWISLKALKNNASFDGGDSLGLANRGLTMCFAAKPLNSKRPAG